MPIFSASYFLSLRETVLEKKDQKKIRVLEERGCTAKNGLEEHYPVWGFKNLKTGRGLG